MPRSRSVLACLGAAGAVLAAGTGDAFAAPAAAGPQAGPQATGLSLVQVRTSLLGTHYTFQETYRGLPVLGGYYLKHVGKDGTVSVSDGRVPVRTAVAPAASVPQTAAHHTALGRVPGSVRRSQLAILPGGTPRLVWSIQTAQRFRVLVDARGGDVVEVRSMVKNVDGTGRVFDPNPVVKQQNEALTDRNDANAAVPAAAYSTVTLRHLDGSGFLRGTYARLALPRGRLARSSTNTFNFQRNSDFFEQVMAYHAVDSVQSYIQSLGFTDVNNEAQDLLTNTIADDQSFYDPSDDSITLGAGGVDDAEDVEVTWHEYGHAVQDDQVPGFGESEEAGAIGEGFGDYLALTMSQANSPNSSTTPWACIMDWDSTSYTSGTPHCIRRADTTKHYPEDATGEVHDDGEIWSHALYDINRGLGRNRANQVILEAQFSFAPDTSFAAAAAATVNAAQTLFGSSAAATVRAAFQARGIL
jgi:hypothetical protein